MSRTTLLSLLAVCFVTAAGCGGGGGGGGSSLPVNPATTLHTFTPGDSWTLSINGTETGRAESFSGTRTQSVSATTFNGNPAIRLTTSDDLTFPDGPSSSIADEILTQDSNGTHELAEVEDGSEDDVTSTTYSEPSTIGLGTAASGTTVFESGLHQTETYNVTGKERVTVPAGTFDCWMVHYTMQDTDSNTINAHFDFDPAAGRVVKASVVDSFLAPALQGRGVGGTVQLTDTFTMKLQSTTVSASIKGRSVSIGTALAPIKALVKSMIAARKA